jgi:hypothetical protein
VANNEMIKKKVVFKLDLLNDKGTNAKDLILAF